MEHASPTSAKKNFVEDPPSEVPYVGSVAQAKDSTEDKLEVLEEILEWVPTGSDVDIPSEERESTITPPHVLVSGVGTTSRQRKESKVSKKKRKANAEDGKGG